MIAIVLLSPPVSFFINNYLSQGEEGEQGDLGRGRAVDETGEYYDRHYLTISVCLLLYLTIYLKVKKENKEILVEGGLRIQQEIIMIAILLLSPFVSCSI